MNMGIMKKIVMALLCLAFLTGRGDVLYWTVDGDATIDGEEGSSLYSFIGSEPYDGAPDYNICYSARVVVKDRSGGVVGILDDYY